MKHVVVLNQFALPRSEGGGTRHVDLFGRLEDWRTLIIAGDRNHYTQRRFTTPDRRLHLVPIPPQEGRAASRALGWFAYALQAFVVTVRLKNCDVVYGSSPQPFAALAGLAAARLRNLPFVLEIRDLWPESVLAAGRIRPGGLTHRALVWLEILLVRSADHVVCVTTGWEEHLQKLGCPSNRVTVVPNGTEPADFDVPEQRQELRARHRVEGFTAIFAGAHGEKDGIDLVLDAARDSAEVNFLLVGSGPVKARAMLRAEEQGLTNVSFRDPVPKEHLAELLRACDVGLHAVAPLSVFDKGMSPNKLFDYLAAELPIVSNAAVPLQSVMRDGECGRLGGPHALAECLEAVRLASPAERVTWSRRGRALLRQRFSRADAARQLEQLLDHVSTAGKATA